MLFPKQTTQQQIIFRMLQEDNTIDEGSDSKIYANENENENDVEGLGEIELEVHDDNDDDNKKAVDGSAGSLKINLITLSEAEYDDKEIITGDGVIRVRCSYILNMLYICNIRIQHASFYQVSLTPPFEFKI